MKIPLEKYKTSNFVEWMAYIQSKFYTVAEMPTTKRSLKLEGLAPWSVAREIQRQQPYGTWHAPTEKSGEYEWEASFEDASLFITVNSMICTRRTEGTPGEWFDELADADFEIEIENDTEGGYQLNKNQIDAVSGYLKKLLWRDC